MNAIRLMEKPSVSELGKITDLDNELLLGASTPPQAWRRLPL
jgi:hypothetical protein